jgi:hypothetical protein
MHDLIALRGEAGDRIVQGAPGARCVRGDVDRRIVAPTVDIPAELIGDAALKNLVQPVRKCCGVANAPDSSRRGKHCVLDGVLGSIAA